MGASHVFYPWLAPVIKLMKISDLLVRQFKLMLIKMLTEVKRAMHELSENFNKEKKYKKVYKEIIEL